MSDQMLIQSHRGQYSVVFDDQLLSDPSAILQGTPHFVIDAKVARLYKDALGAAINHPAAVLIEATEVNKSLEKIIPVVERLVADGVRRDHMLVAIGGGVIQDITCFVASTLLRGLPWHFVPTTLLAQADSCIGSKSSINLGATKNILGTFNPPERIHIATPFLDTLNIHEMRSGVGEIIKVHAIAGQSSFDQLAGDFAQLFDDRAILSHYRRKALEIKRAYIEQDEFDRGIRNVFNYGHSFGHAIESATQYVIPHGIAVTMGMEMANRIAAERGLLPMHHYERMHPILRENYNDFAHVAIPSDAVLLALMKDKKNTSTALGLILPVGKQALVQRVSVIPDNSFKSQCAQAITGLGI